MRRNEWIYATPAQQAYLRRLRADCFARRVNIFGGHFVNERPLEALLRSEASREIDERKRALEAARSTRGAT